MIKYKHTTFIVLLLFIGCSFLIGQEDKTLPRVKKLIEKEKYADALLLLNHFIAKDTGNAEAYAQRGKCLRITGLYDQALTDLNRAILLKSNAPESYTSLGVLYSLTGKHDLAMENYNKAIKMDSSSAPAYNSRGSEYYYFLNQHDKALEDYAKAITLDSKFFKPYFNRAIILRLRDMPEHAITDLNIAMKLHPKSQLIYNERGWAYYAKGDYKNAVKDYLKSIKYNTNANVFEKLDEGPTYYAIGYCYQEMNKYSKSQKYFQLAKLMGYVNGK